MSGSGATSLTGYETVSLTTTAGATLIVTTGQIAALVAQQVAIDLSAIMAQVIAQITSASGAGIDLSEATVTPGNVTTKTPLATLIAELLPLSGGTLNGALILSGLPVTDMQATTKGYVDNAVASGSGNVGAALSEAEAAAATATAAAQAAQSAGVNAIAAQKGIAGGIAALDSGGALIINGTSVFGFVNGLTIYKPLLGTSDPGVLGAWWNNGGYIGVSQGGSS